jgi:hypothetical protein
VCNGAKDGTRVVGERYAAQATILIRFDRDRIRQSVCSRHQSAAPHQAVFPIVPEAAHDSTFRFRDSTVTLIDSADSADRDID